MAKRTSLCEDIIYAILVYTYKTEIHARGEKSTSCTL
jgi:hypothetical protein